MPLAALRHPLKALVPTTDKHRSIEENIAGCRRLGGEVSHRIKDRKVAPQGCIQLLMNGLRNRIGREEILIAALKNPRIVVLLRQLQCVD